MLDRILKYLFPVYYILMRYDVIHSIIYPVKMTLSIFTELRIAVSFIHMAYLILGSKGDCRKMQSLIP